MRAEDWYRREFELEGWPVKLTGYRIGGAYLAEIESTDSGATIARATGKTQAEAEKDVLETATRRVLRTRRTDLGLTVGG
jgi:hypothetical protein